jgi:hypothetical protein
MPLSHATNRRNIHIRTIQVQAFARDDELFDVEAQLIDRKPFAFWRIAQPAATPPGQPLHDISIRLTLDQALVVRAIEASSDSTPFGICREAEATLRPLVGERIASGWSSKVKGLLRGKQSCTHLMEMLITMATPALQGIRGLAREERLDDTKLGAGKLDSCYAYSSERAVIKMYWPEQYREPRPAHPKPDVESSPLNPEETGKIRS